MSFDLKQLFPETTIPTALVIGSGLNVLDHHIFMSDSLPSNLLSNALQQGEKRVVVSLKSEDCATVSMAMNRMMQDMKNQLERMKMRRREDQTRIKRKTHLDVDDDDDVIELYEEIQREGGKEIGVVIVIQDFECFATEVMNRMIKINSDFHRRGMRIVWVIGIATDPQIIQTSLRLETYSLLETEDFCLLPSHKQLQHFINEVLISESCPIQLGFGCLEWLTRHFEECHQTVENFLTQLQFILLDHFQTQPLSILASKLFKDKDILLLSASHLSAIRSLPSVQREAQRIEKQQQQEGRKSLWFDIQTRDHPREMESGNDETKVKAEKESDKELKRQIIKWRRDLWNRKGAFAIAFRCYACFLSSSTLQSIVKRQLIAILTATKPTDRSRSKLLIKLRVELSNLSFSESLLRQWHSIVSRDFQSYQRLVELIDDLLVKIGRERREERKIETSQRLCDDLIQFVESLMQDFLQPLSLLPMHEVLFYNRWRTLHRAFQCGASRSLLTALLRPHRYFEDGRSKDHLHSHHHRRDRDPDQQQLLQPDMCLGFGFYWSSESAALNLHDWFQDFKARVAQQNQDFSLPLLFPPRSDASEKQLQARFVRVLNEMRFMGLIETRESSRSRADFVFRTVFEIQ